MRPLTRRAFARSLGIAAVFPALARCTGRQAEQAEVLVVGAGMAGLYAASLLQAQGIRPLVIEASDRVGGRLRALDGLQGSPPPAGASADAPYARMFALLDELGIGSEPLTSSAGLALSINGALLDADRWPGSPANRLEGAERRVLPQDLADFFLGREAALGDPGSWLSPGLRDVDERSLDAELRRLGASAEAMRLIEVLYDAKGIATLSALFAHRRLLLTTASGSGSFRIRAGSAGMAEALAARLGDRIRLRQAVAQIAVRGDSVECRCANGRRYRARFALCAVPWSVLREVVLTPAPAQAAIIRELPYNKVTRVRLAVRRRFWEDDGLPAAMIADRPFEKLVADDSRGELVCWINGQQAAKLDDWNSDRAGRFVLREIVAARPAAANSLAVLDVTSWGQDPYVLGSEAAWAPGQISRFAAGVHEPWGPVHWIGEHMAIRQHGVEGALESAEREVGRLLARMGASSR